MTRTIKRLIGCVIILSIVYTVIKLFFFVDYYYGAPSVGLAFLYMIKGVVIGGSLLGMIILLHWLFN